MISATTLLERRLSSVEITVDHARTIVGCACGFEGADSAYLGHVGAVNGPAASDHIRLLDGFCSCGDAHSADEAAHRQHRGSIVLLRSMVTFAAARRFGDAKRGA